MNRGLRPFLLVLMVVVALTGLHFLPSVSVGGRSLRQVDLLADVFTYSPPTTDTVRDGSSAAVTAAADTLDSRPSTLDPMSHFYSVLDSARRRPVRIAYFGDSFIEGDIMTAALRNLLQEEYGGYGVGWVDIQSAVAGFRTTVVELSRGWQEHNAVGANSSGFDPTMQGIGGRYYTPTPGAYIDIRCQGRVYGERLDTVQRATLFFTPDSLLALSASVNGTAYQPLYEHSADSVPHDPCAAVRDTT